MPGASVLSSGSQSGRLSNPKWFSEVARVGAVAVDGEDLEVPVGEGRCT